MAERAQLRIVDPETGELSASASARVQELEDQLEGAERDIRSWRARYAHLRAEVTADENHDLFPSATRVFNYWRERCKHPRTKFTPEHFKLMLPYLRDYGEDMCKTAVDGAAFDPYTTVRRNGSVARHDALTLIFRNPDKFADFANRAPHHLPNPDHIKTLANALAFLDPDKPIGECAEEARRRLGGN